MVFDVHNVQKLRLSVESLEKEQNCFQNEIENFMMALLQQQKEKQIAGEDPAEDPANVGASFDIDDYKTNCHATKLSPKHNNNDTNATYFEMTNSVQSLLRVQKLLSLQQNKLMIHEKEQFEKEKADMKRTIEALQKEKEQLLAEKKRQQEQQQLCYQTSTITECSENSDSIDTLKKENNKLHMTLKALKRERNIIQYYIKDAYAYEEGHWKQQTKRRMSNETYNTVNSCENEGEENDRNDNVDHLQQQQLQVALETTTQEKDRYQQQYQQMKAQYHDLLRRQRKSNKKKDVVKEQECPSSQLEDTVQKEKQQEGMKQEEQPQKEFTLNTEKDGNNVVTENVEGETVEVDEGWLLGANEEILIMESCDSENGCCGGFSNNNNIELVVQLTNSC